MVSFPAACNFVRCRIHTEGFMNKLIEQKASNDSSKAADQPQTTAGNAAAAPLETSPGLPDAKALAQGSLDKSPAKAAVSEPLAR